MKTLSPIEETQENNKEVIYNNAPLIHLSALIKYLGVPFGNILGPLITWLIWRNQSTFDDANGKSALNFNISFTIYRVIIILIGAIMFLSPIITIMSHNAEENIISLFLSIPGLLIFIFGIALIEIVWLILVIIAAIKSGQGNIYKYPLTIEFIK